MEVSFTLNLHDDEGDVYDNCLLLHFDKKTILKLDNIEELEDIIAVLQDIKTELNEKYGICSENDYIQKYKSVQ
jgi:hypothetical protein